MNSKPLIAIVAMLTPCLALAQSGGKYECSYGDLKRRVEILTEPGVSVPCEVHYYKDTEAPGDKQVLWSATTDATYCETKTTEFVAKLEGWGWDCGQGGAAAPEPAPAPEAEAAPEPEAAPEVADDTDVLTPATESESSESE